MAYGLTFSASSAFRVGVIGVLGLMEFIGCTGIHWTRKTFTFWIFCTDAHNRIRKLTALGPR